MIIGILLAAIASGVSQVPTVDSIKAASRANSDCVKSFVLKAHAIEAEMRESTAGWEEGIIKGTAGPFESFAQHAATRPALARYLEGRHKESLAIGVENVTAIRERSKPTPINLIISCDASIPAFVKEVIDSRNVTAIAQSLGLGETATATLGKTHGEILTESSFIAYYPKQKVAWKSPVDSKSHDSSKIEVQRLYWLGILPGAFDECDELSIREEGPGTNVTIRAVSDGISREYLLDAVLDFRVVRYTATSASTGQVYEKYVVGEYRTIQDGIAIPVRWTLTRMVNRVAGSYSLDCTVDSFELNPQIDRVRFSPPEGIRIREMPK